jgi:oligoendopeptidase F
MRASYLMLALALAAAGIPGCKKIAGLAGDAVKGQSNDPAKSQAAVETMGHYAKGFNALISSPQQMVKRYYQTVPGDGPEEGKKYHIFPEHNTAERNIAEAKTAFGEAAKSAPESLKHLEPLANATVADIEKVAVTYKSFYNYFQAEDFKDDKGAKGKQLHEQFVKEATSFRQNIDKFENALTEIEGKQADEELKEYADKATYSHQFRNFNRQANKLINAKPEQFASQYPAVETAFNELSAFAKSKGTAQASFGAYVSAAERFYADAKRMKRAVEAKEKEEQIDSISDSLTSNYNSLVNMSNSLRSLEANNMLK